MSIFRKLPRWVWLGGAGLVVVAIAVVSLVRGDGDTLDDLARAQRESAEASTSADRIRRSLKEIAGNLESASGLSSQSSKIEELTGAQRRSLRDLVALLRGQLGTLERSATVVESTTSSTASLTRLSRAQSEELRSAVAVLRRLRTVAADASGDSGVLAQAARYSARLARDSRKAFER
ncbi:MAG: hypothetical protein M3285_10950 [Actinomycetota bacterium]|nr:hypothetical protein [Actinomycetota bacterium]